MTLSSDELQRLTQWMHAGGISELTWEHPTGRVHLVVETAPAHEATATAVAPGHFLLAHPARETEFAPPGSTVRQGDTLGLVQVGTVFTSVTAPCDGTVLRRLAEPGALVGYGTPLIAIAGRAA
jgi:acetyl-CoA carboxylase biotin carboxyl carrier protein